MKHHPSSSLLASVGLLLFLASCSDPDPQPAPAASSQQILTYFVDVALGFEFGSASRVTRKWKQPIRVFIGGVKTPELTDELNSIVTELRDLAPDLAISLTADSTQSNFYIFLGPGSVYGRYYPPAQPNITANWGLFEVQFNSDSELTGAWMYVDIQRANRNEQKHLLREEFTQALGFGRDSDLYPDSIFYSLWTATTTYAPIDRQVIQLLYHPYITTGMDEASVRQTLPALMEQLNM